MNTGRTSAGGLTGRLACLTADGGGTAGGPGDGRSEQPTGDSRSVGGPAEQIALTELAAELAQGLELLGGLDPLGHDPQVQRLAEGDDRPSERPVFRARVVGADELAGDLQDVDGEPA